MVYRAACAAKNSRDEGPSKSSRELEEHVKNLKNQKFKEVLSEVDFFLGLPKNNRGT